MNSGPIKSYQTMNSYNFIVYEFIDYEFIPMNSSTSEYIYEFIVVKNPDGEFDGFPGRRERTNQCFGTAIVSSIPTGPNIRRNFRS